MRYNYLHICRMLLLKKSPTPFQLIHFVTSRCNARCQHCFYWSELNKQKKELELWEIEKMAKTLKHMYYLMISGGEPFLRDDLEDVIECYYRNTRVNTIVIPTNGILTELICKMSRNILKNCRKARINLAVSLDGFEEQHNNIRGLDCFSKAVETYSGLKELRKEFLNMRLSVITTMTSLNQHSIKEFSKYVRNELKPDAFALNLIRGKPKNAVLKDINLENYKACMAEKGSGIRSKMNILRAKVIAETAEKKRYVLPCLAGSLDAVLYEDGNVYPCELLNRKIGNIRDYDYNFRALWSSKNAADVRRFIKESRCFCTHECFIRTGMLFNAKYLFRIIR